MAPEGRRATRRYGGCRRWAARRHRPRRAPARTSFPRGRTTSRGSVSIGALKSLFLCQVIDVSGKEFKFTWASERGELCDIYEERRSGEDGNGLLLECGSAWRKVNVQRILDESTKNLVKMRSKEAERLSKSRKSIVLDPANPSVKSQARSMAAAAVEGLFIAEFMSFSAFHRRVHVAQDLDKAYLSVFVWFRLHYSSLTLVATIIFSYIICN
ncbi:dentin sialophosphoprotein-related [Zea mays]|uniref:Dentin sialophosphoprotein-related n=1 Tax=Zea mays TaxID=4577 RepID=A0A1D6H470_MAIZE|nr:dentin sialophosphoprotein-related [Zea mays]